jgi:hypothetical protein
LLKTKIGQIDLSNLFDPLQSILRSLSIGVSAGGIERNISICFSPSSVLCKDDFFKINRSKLITGKDIENELTIYVREDVGTVKKKKNEER